jgi:metal-responsive CopG/Arc/MetJ family transcriptional regulator
VVDRKRRVTVTLTKELVARLDAHVKKNPGLNRSALIEQWLAHGIPQTPPKGRRK